MPVATCCWLFLWMVIGQIDQVRQALTLADFDIEAAQAKLAPMPRPMKRPLSQPGEPRVGGVLLLLFEHQAALHIALTRRRAHLKAHAGQISFPGGRNEPPETLQTTALRETEEEIGVSPASVEILGTLTSIYIPPSDYVVYPFVGWVKNGRRPHFAPAPAEVAEVLEVPLLHLLNPANQQQEQRTLFNGVTLNVPYFDVYGDKVWGGTAVMLSEFLERLKVVNIAP